MKNITVYITIVGTLYQDKLIIALIHLFNVFN